jgi:hypothetical protein
LWSRGRSTRSFDFGATIAPVVARLDPGVLSAGAQADPAAAPLDPGYGARAR